MKTWALPVWSESVTPRPRARTHTHTQTSGVSGLRSPQGNAFIKRLIKRLFGVRMAATSLEAVKRKIKLLQEQADGAEDKAEKLQKELALERKARETVRTRNYYLYECAQWHASRAFQPSMSWFKQFNVERIWPCARWCCRINVAEFIWRPLCAVCNPYKQM